jgi:hypothetical protein
MKPMLSVPLMYMNTFTGTEQAFTVYEGNAGQEG